MKHCELFEIVSSKLKNYCGKGTHSAFFKNILAPEWWEDTMADKNGLVYEMAFTVARRLGIDFCSLIHEDQPVRTGHVNALFKKKASVSSSELLASTAFMQSVARYVLAPIEQPGLEGQKADEIRSKILEQSRSVDLYSLLDFCWDFQIPVLCFSKVLPKSSKDVSWKVSSAITFRSNDKYCIMVLKDDSFNAWPLFMLAHELGHIVLGHLDKDGYVEDYYHDNDGETNPKEAKANEFALKLLCGGFSMPDGIGFRTPSQLARWTVDIGTKKSIDPGHLALRYAWKYGNYPMSQAALKIINQEGETRPMSLIMRKCYKNLSFDDYTEEQGQFIASTILESI